MHWYDIDFLFPSYQVIKDHANLIDNKRVFFSEMRDDNLLDCLVQKLNIARVPHNVCLLILMSKHMFVFLYNKVMNITKLFLLSGYIFGHYCS